MGTRFLEKRNVTPAQAVKILQKKGVQVSEKEAKKILDFLYIFAKLVLKEYFRDKEPGTKE